MSVEQVSISKDGSVVGYRMSNADKSLEAQFSSYGARITHLFVRDRYGNPIDVVTGFDSHEELLNSIQNIDDPYMGAVIGRVSGRVDPVINVPINNTTYTLNANQPNHVSLHGGHRGFDKQIWTGKILSHKSPAQLEFKLLSPHGDENYPGDLLVKIVYSITDDNELKLDYSAELVNTDKTKVDETILCLTNHVYFNLSGFKEPTVRDHYVRFNSDKFLEMDDKFKPTGAIKSVVGTPMDFFQQEQSRKIGERIDIFDKQTLRGYDHVFPLLDTKTNSSATTSKIQKDAAEVWCESSGIRLLAKTDEPCIIFYTSNWMSDKLVGKGINYCNYCSFTLECQRFTNAAQVPAWREQVSLKANETYSQSTTYKFETF